MTKPELPRSSLTKLTAKRVVRHRYRILVILGVATLVAAAACLRIRFDFTPQAIYGGGDGLVATSEQFKAAFAAEDSLLLIVLEATGERDALDAELLNWQAEVSQRLESVANVARVDTLATLELPRPSIWPPFVTVAPVINDFPVDEHAEQRLRDVVNQYDLLERTLISPDRRAGLVIVALRADSAEITRLQQVVGDVEVVLDKCPPPAGYRCHLSGLPALRVDIVRDLEMEQLVQVPLAGLLFLVLLALIFRNAVAAVLPLIAVGAAVVWTVGTMATAGMSFNLITNVLPVLLLVIGVSNCVHVMARYAGECRRRAHVQQAAIRTLTHMLTACFLTCLTTAIGFISLAAARSESLREFGWEAGLGMGFLYVSTIFLLGAALPLFVPRGIRGGDAEAPSATARVVAAAGYVVARHPRTTLFVSGLIVLGCLGLARNVVVNSHVIETYPDGHPARKTFQLIEDKLGGMTALEIDLAADAPGRFLEPDVFKQVADFVQFAAGQDDVILVRSYVDLHREVESNRRRPGHSRTNELTREKILRAHKFLNVVGSGFQYGSLLTANETRARIVCRIRDRGTRTTLQLAEVLEAQLGKTFPTGSGITARVDGEAYVHARSMDRLVRDLVVSLCGASVAVFAVIGILFRSLRVGLLCTVPNLTPLFLTLGYMGLRGFELNASNVIVFAVSLGIAVDNTIHFLARFREEMQRKGDVVEAVHQTLRSTGRAIVLTSTLIICGLSVMLLSQFLPTRRFAELTTVTMAAALLGDLLLLPASLTLFWREPRSRQTSVSHRQ